MKYWKFNLICLASGCIFIIGIIWQWRFLFIHNLNYVDQKIVMNETDESVGLRTENSELVYSVKEEDGQNNDIDLFEKIEREEQEEAARTIQAFNELQGDLDEVIVNLDVPYTSQAPEKDWSYPWQDACEEAAVLMLDAYYKGYGLSPLFSKDEILKMIKWQKEKGMGTSIEIEKIALLFEEYLIVGKKPKIIENPTVEQIKKYVSAGSPVLLVADGTVLPNKWYTGDGPDYHTLIIRGYTEDRFITNDPGVNRGRNFSFSIDSVMNAMHDWNGGGVKNGRKVIIVLE